MAFEIKVEGNELPSTLSVESIETRAEANRIPRVRLVVLDGSPAAGSFEGAGTKVLEPGKKLKISVGYVDSAIAPIFEGIIVKQGVQIPREGPARVVVHAADEALKMCVARNSEVFTKIKDSDLIAKLIKAHGLSASVSATSVVHEDIVQYYASDWDLAVTRAELNGMIVLASGGKVTVAAPRTSAGASLRVAFGESLLDFDAEIDATTQLAKTAIKSYAWDAATQKVASAGPGSLNVTEPGNLSSDTLAKVLGIKAFPQQTGGTLVPKDLTAWSSAELLKSKLSKLRGTVTYAGSVKVAPGGVIEIAGVSAAFSGNAFVSGVRHEIRDGLWTTTAQLGLSARWFAAEADHIEAPPAAGQLPAMSGLQPGIVKEVAKDPDGNDRIAITLPLLHSAAKPVWARYASPYATNKAGFFFLPEVGDEVVVAFMNDDPRFPVVIGNLYGKKHVPPFAPDKNNDTKAIVTRGQLKVTFDDKNKIVEITTPKKQSVKIDDKSGSITLVDANKNKVALSKGGITIESASNIKLSAKGNITLDAKANIALTAKANASMEGLQVSHKAKLKFSAQGTATAELTASGMLTVRGALVKIN